MAAACSPGAKMSAEVTTSLGRTLAEV